MKILKRIAIVLAVIIAIPLILALFAGKEYTVTKEVVVNRPTTEVFAFVKQTKNQSQYNQWLLDDSNLKINSKGVDGRPGFVFQWEGEVAGKGELEIKRMVENKEIDGELRFIEPFAGLAQTKMTTEPTSANQTKLSWTYHGEMSYPSNAMLLFADMDDILGPNLQKSLDRAKKLIETPISPISQK